MIALSHAALYARDLEATKQFFISFFSARFNDKILRVINIVCGAIIIFYGAKLLLQFFQLLL